MSFACTTTAAFGRCALGVEALFAPTCLSVLIFHRVHAQPDALFPGEPEAARFDELMRLLARVFHVMTLGEAADHLARGRLPARALAITFDDGYADNALVALPILERHGLRATFFVSSGFLDGGLMWNDAVIECLRRCCAGQLDLAPFGMGSVRVDGVATRRQAIDTLLPRIKYLPPGERDEAIARLQRICGVERLPDDLMMSSRQVLALHAAGMEIGGHTRNHPILTALEPAAAEREIAQGRDDLEAVIGARVDLFAYPNGQPGVDYAAAHVDMVRRLGFRAAVSTAVGVARAAADPFQLPRYTPWGRALPLWTARLLRNRRKVRYALVGGAT